MNAGSAPHKPQTAPAPRAEIPANKAKVPPSSGTVSSHRRYEDDLPMLTGDLRDLEEAPILREPPKPQRQAPPSPSIGDVAALFADDEPVRPSRRPAAENRRVARTCPECDSIVPVGMSLCNSCGLDLDTGQRIELADEFEEDDVPLPEAPSGPPVSILIIGLGTMVAFGMLTLFSFLKLDSMSGTALGLVSLFGVLASIMFVAGKSIKMMTIALMLGAFVNIVTMIIVPVIVANTFDETVAPEAVDVSDIIAKPKPENAEGAEAAAIEPAPLAQRIDSTKITWGIIVLLIDGILLAYINTAGVRRHFERRQAVGDDYGPLVL